jgi:GrpB-like predicted nucleotidyltransferase (UPF0157 family)
MENREEKRIIQVVQYNPQWPALFQKETELILPLLAKELIQIHHIGSTAVPGLKAKPIIDIMLTVKNVTGLDTYDNKMSSIGYIPKGEFGIPGRRFYLKGLYSRTHHIHAFSIGSPHIQRHLAFRDFLISHPLIAKEYGELKVKCANECENDIDKYCDGKNEFIKFNEAKAISLVEFYGHY